MRPFQVLEMQADLVYRLQNETFAQYASYCHEASLNDAVPFEAPDRKRHIERQVKILDRALFLMANMGEAFHVTDDMSTLVMGASELLDDEDTIDVELTPAPYGFARMDSPITFEDVRGNQMKVHWVMWAVVSTGPEPQDIGVMVSTWNDGDDPDDVAKIIQEGRSFDGDNVIPEEMRRCVGRWQYVGSSFHRQGALLGPPLRSPGEMMVQVADRLRLEGVEARPMTNLIRYVHALFLMLRQSIVRTSKHEPNSKQRRRLAKMPIPGTVTVIELRRSVYPEREPGESHVEWSHRWLVRGHWRWQPCGPQNSERRRIWIHGYVKGPEDAPLVVKKHVYDLRR